MPIDVTCDQCGSRYRVPEQFAGKQAKCKKCGNRIDVPVPADDPFAGLEVLPDAPRVQAPPPARPVRHQQSYAPAPPPIDYGRGPRSSKIDSVLRVSDGTAKIISIVLLILTAVGLFLLLQQVLGKIGEVLPPGLKSRFNVLLALALGWDLMLFFVLYTPALLWTCATAAGWFNDSVPSESAYLRAAGTCALPCLLFLLILKLGLSGEVPLAIILLLLSPAVMIAGLRMIMGIKWSSTFTSAGLLIVVMLVIGFGRYKLTAPVGKAMQSISGLTPESVQQYAKDHPEEMKAAQQERQQQRQQYYQEQIKKDPLYGVIDDLALAIGRFDRSVPTLTREQIQDKYDELNKLLQEMKPADRSELWEGANGRLTRIHMKIRESPSEDPPNDLYLQYGTPLRLAKASEDAFGEPEYQFGELQVRPLAKTRIDIRAYGDRKNGLRWKFDDEREYSVELEFRPITDDGKQKQAWLAARPLIMDRAEARKLLALSVQEPYEAKSGQLNGMQWTRIDETERIPGPEAPGGDLFTKRCRYVARTPTGWAIASVFRRDTYQATKASEFADQFVQGIRLATAEDKPRSPWEPALVVREYLYRSHDDPAPILREAGAEGIKALQEFCQNNKDNVWASRLLDELTAPKTASRPPVGPRQGGTSAPPRETTSLFDVDVDDALKKLTEGNTFAKRDALKALAAAMPDDAKRDAVAKALEEMLLSKETWSDAAEYGKALEVWWRPQTVGAMLPLLEEDGDRWKRPAAIKVLAATKDKKAVFPILRWLIKEPEPVVAALRSMGPVAEDDVMKLLRDRNNEVRRNAARIIEEIGTSKCLILLRAASTDGRDPAAANAAKQALEAVNERVRKAKAASQPAP